MSAQAQHASLPAIGTPFGGGFFVGLFRLNNETYALIVSPKVQGELKWATWSLNSEAYALIVSPEAQVELKEEVWGQHRKIIPGAQSYNDGLANTQAMAEAGSDLARWMLGLDIDGFTDWYLPSRDELEIIYRNLKPTTHGNHVCRHGENPSSVPVSYPYTENSPAQTAVVVFIQGCTEALEDRWYWSSSQFSYYYAWSQNFLDGYQDRRTKSCEHWARAVRRVLIS